MFAQQNLYEGTKHRNKCECTQHNLYEGTKHTRYHYVAGKFKCHQHKWFEWMSEVNLMQISFYFIQTFKLLALLTFEFIAAFRCSIQEPLWQDWVWMVHLLLDCVTSNAVVNERMYVDRFLLHSTAVKWMQSWECNSLCCVFYSNTYIYVCFV